MNQIEKDFSHLLKGTNPLQKIKELVCSDESIAIHWWDGSWNVPEAFK